MVLLPLGQNFGLDGGDLRILGQQRQGGQQPVRGHLHIAVDQHVSLGVNLWQAFHIAIGEAPVHGQRQHADAGELRVQK